MTWRSGTKPYILESEEDVLNAQAQGLVDLVKTNIVINCPVVYTLWRKAALGYAHRTHDTSH